MWIIRWTVLLCSTQQKCQIFCRTFISGKWRLITVNNVSSVITAEYFKKRPAFFQWYSTRWIVCRSNGYERNTCIYWPEAPNNDPPLREGLEGTRADNYYPSHMPCDTFRQVHAKRQGCSPRAWEVDIHPQHGCHRPSIVSLMDRSLANLSFLTVRSHHRGEQRVD